MLEDKEEVGSVGATGMHSQFFNNVVAELIALEGDYNDLKLRRCLSNSCLLSSDVGAAYDPNYPMVNEMKNTAFFSKGLLVMKFTGRGGKSGSNDANPEFIAKLRNIFDDNDVSWQRAEIGRVDQGGVGTIAYILANYNMNVIDSGVPVQNMHSPWEVTSKVDIFEAKQGYVAFCKNM